MVMITGVSEENAEKTLGGNSMRRMIRFHGALGAILCTGMGFPVSAQMPDAVPTVHQQIRHRLKDAALTLQFRGSTPNQFGQWQKQFRGQLNMLLGDSGPPEEWTVRELARQEQDDHVRLELMLEADGFDSVPVYLLLPVRTKAERLPAVLCVHGHGQFGHDAVVGRRDRPGIAAAIESANYDYGLQFVRRGYAVVAPCLIPFGPRVDRESYRGNDPCAVTFVRMQALGLLPITENLRSLRWGIDLLQNRPEVDPSRIGCAGLSYGGRMAMLVSAIDERIRVSAVSGALNLMQERFAGRHSCGSQMIPGLLKYGDYSEIGSLIAPRPCVWETGSRDGLIVAGWDERFRERLETAYTASGFPEALKYDRFEGGHRWSGAVAFPLFDRVLKSGGR